MYILYQLGVYTYYLFILIASLFNKKAKLWIDGRKHQHELLKQALPSAKRIWFHFASLGEFEQGRNVLESIHQKYPEYKIIISFFSPSGYEIRKHYALAEKVYYLPLDTQQNAKQFLNHIQPSLIFFTKYEYWHHYIYEAKKRKIPLFVISAIFRKNQLFFKFYGAFQRRILKNIQHFFVQNSESAALLDDIKIQQHTVAGDTRFDRVYQHSLNPMHDTCIETFATNHKVVVIGSSWLKDEEVFANVVAAFPQMKFIIVPHEINSEHLHNIRKIFTQNIAFYSEYKNKPVEEPIKILVVDTIGLLSSIYQYASYCYIGGGFGAGIHNTLEAAVYGKPIFFGPNYYKFEEAKQLIEIGAAKSITNSEELITHIKQLEQDELLYKETCKKSKQFVLEQKGATEIILKYLAENNFLS